MKITVFGATGGTGKLLIEQALAKNYHVTAFTRSPQKLPNQNKNLTVFEGDIREPEKVAAAIQGADAVLSALGPTDNKAQYVVTEGIKNILSAMQQHQVSRLIISAGAGVGDPKDEPKFINKLINGILKLVSKNVYEDMVKAVQLIRDSDTDWTIVRAPMLTDDPPSGNINAAWVGKGMGMRLSRADFAAFMLQQIEDDTYLHQAPALSSN